MPKLENQLLCMNGDDWLILVVNFHCSGVYGSRAQRSVSDVVADGRKLCILNNVVLSLFHNIYNPLSEGLGVGV